RRMACAENCRDHGVDVFVRESRERHLAGQALAQETGDDMSKTGVGLVTSIGEQQPDWLVGKMPCKVGDKFETCVVTPVEIFENHEQRLRSTENREEAG